MKWTVSEKSIIFAYTTKQTHGIQETLHPKGKKSALQSGSEFSIQLRVYSSSMLTEKPKYQGKHGKIHFLAFGYIKGL